MQPYIAAAKLIDPQAGAAIEAAANGGSVGFAWEYDVRINGAHDWNTIAINIKSKGLPPAYGGIALLHEWGHVLRCAGGPPLGGPVSDGCGGNDPCYACVHRDMQAAS